jgi:hypothetical protein
MFTVRTCTLVEPEKRASSQCYTTGYRKATEELNTSENAEVCYNRKDQAKIHPLSGPAL